MCCSFARETAETPGGDVFRLVCEPSVDVLGGVVLVHGLGDHSQRYERLLAYLAEKGIASVATDLPGHGRSSGRRGHIAGIAEVDRSIEGARERLEGIVGGAPCGIAGHSMGGLLVLDHFARGRGGKFALVWLSSTLVEPTHGRGRLTVAACQILSKVAPELTIRSGVRLSACYDAGDVGISRDEERASGTHNRISLRLAVELLAAGGRVAGAGDLFGSRPVLMTHGERDEVCPPSYARALFDRLPTKDKRFVTVAGGLHEPWHLPDTAETVRSWMVERLRAS